MGATPTLRAIILAAGQGLRLRPLTDDGPKCLVPLHGRPLLDWQMQALRAAGVEDIVVVGGYRLERLRAWGVPVVENPRYAATHMVATLACADAWFEDGFLMAYGDIVYGPETIAALLAAPHDLAVAVDRRWLSYWRQRSADVLADAESLRVDAAGRLASIGQKAIDLAAIQGQYMGLVVCRGQGVRHVRTLIENERRANAEGRTLIKPGTPLDRLYMTDLLQGAIDAGWPVWPIWMDGGWLEIDTLDDWRLAARLSRPTPQGLIIER